MKIKGDFVTNSSSTNYLFIFGEPNRFSLYRALMLNADLFDLSVDFGWRDAPFEIGVASLIEEMEYLFTTPVEIVRKEMRSLYRFDEAPRIHPITKYLKETKKDTRSYAIEAEKARNKCDSQMEEIYREERSTGLVKLGVLLDCQRKGLNYSLSFSFGNDGGIYGSPVAQAFDTRGSFPNVTRQNLGVVVTRHD